MNSLSTCLCWWGSQAHKVIKLFLNTFCSFPKSRLLFAKLDHANICGQRVGCLTSRWCSWQSAGSERDRFLSASDQPVWWGPRTSRYTACSWRSAGRASAAFVPGKKRKDKMGNGATVKLDQIIKTRNAWQCPHPGWDVVDHWGWEHNQSWWQEITPKYGVLLVQGHGYKHFYMFSSSCFLN